MVLFETIRCLFGQLQLKPGVAEKLYLLQFVLESVPVDEKM